MGLALVSAWAKSDIGRRRANNEDAFFVNEKVGLFMVADGMGGHRGGDQASRLAIEQAAKEFLGQRNKGASLPLALKEAMNQAAIAVFEAGHNEESLWGMGTTLSALAIGDKEAYVAHIGDSRIYCFRNNKLMQMTKDHSLVNEQLQAGMISEDEAQKSPLRNIITRALGQNKAITADHFSWSLCDQDCFLLCTDGLTTMVSDAKIAQIIGNYNKKTVVELLIKEANNNGGEDNITTILVCGSP